MMLCRRPGTPDPGDESNKWGEAIQLAVQHNDVTVPASAPIYVKLDTYHVMVMGDSIMWGQVPHFQISWKRYLLSKWLS